MDEVMYHLGCRRGSLHKDAIVFGDPDRCKLVFELVDDYTVLANKRGLIVGNASKDNVDFSFAGLGMGGPSWVIGLHEMAESGSRSFIRVGTSGIMYPIVQAGDLFIPNKVVSDEILSSYMLPEGVKPEPDTEMVCKLFEASKTRNYACVQGTVHSKDLLYMEHKDIFPGHERLEKKMQEAVKQGAVVTEMECAATFAYAQARGYKAAAVLAIIDERKKLSRKTQKKAMDVAIDIIVGAAK